MGSRFICFVVFAAVGIAQSDNKPQPRVIEVRGSAEKLVTPNEFTFKIALNERYEKKEKITLEDQEKRLREELKKIGVDAQNDLTVFDLSSRFAYRKRQKDELASRDYRLKLNDLEKIGKLQEIADDLGVARLELIEATHSNLPALRKETKIEAMKAAKAKAEYLLGAIGDKVGKTLFVEEKAEQDESMPLNGRSFTSNEVVARGAYSPPPEPALQFTQIKLRYEVFARFEIE